MTVQTFRDLLSTQPFRPFRVVMSSGKSYDVTHPEMAWVTKSDLIVGVGSDDDVAPDSFKICSLLHITAIEPLVPKTALAPA